MEFLTSFLNNAANDDDIRAGTAYAERIGIRVAMPKWGVSRGDYAFDRERGIIAKGLSSVKYMGAAVAEELYRLSQEHTYDHFTDLLADIDTQTNLNTRQLDILIKLDFFSEFGNQRELLRITALYYDTFNRGQAKKVLRSKIEGTPLEEIVQKYAVCVTKSGDIAKSYTLLDVESILHEAEDAVRAANMPDLPDILKVQNFADIMGYVGYTSGKQEDRRKLYIMETYPAVRKKDGYQFGTTVLTKSIGSGKEGRWTIYNRTFEKCPIKKGDIIWCKAYEKNGIYFNITDYERII